MTPDTPDASEAGQRRRIADTLRYVPPIAALGTAFVLQVVLITDTGGGVLADRMADTGQSWWWYGVACLFGLSVASCLEGGAAYLMDLYDRHLIARDSVWLLRLGMLAYVGVSATMVHWWAGQRGLPEVLAWVLAGMSGSALFLWSRGSRWAQRREMIAAGQLDPALPRLPLASKVGHPIRWVITLYLISWEPVSTVAEARARYDEWRSGPHWWNRTPRLPRIPDTPAELLEPESDTDAGQGPDSPLAPVRSINSRLPRRRPVSRDRRIAEVSTDDLARELDRAYPKRIPGVPSAMSHLRDKFGSCSRERAKTAIRTLSGWRSSDESEPEADDQESEAAAL